MEEGDLDTLYPYEQQMFGSEAWSKLSYIEELADQDYRCYLVAEDADGQVLGDGGLMTIDGTAQIMTVGVVPLARRRGIGRLLVRGLVSEAVKRRAREVLLEVRDDNDAARTLYESEGFEVIGTRRGYYEHGRVDALVMRREL
ncbi:MAG: ribosomal-protein-alanine acetyltransferase [Frankiales bacterium]|nr:ribosomal-protein-alanine acetyltransferase [Frankiales bacterium]